MFTSYNTNYPLQMKKIILLIIAMLLFTKTYAQTNAQLFYDFGSDRKFYTLTLEMFKADKWGNSYFFVDHDFNYDDHVSGPNLSPGGSYLEISRCLNFWQKSAIKAFSLHIEYDGGITKSYPINTGWLFGADYFLHDKQFNNTLNIKALYKNIKKKSSTIPMQLTLVWTCKDVFGVSGLTFDGFADFWWETHDCAKECSNDFKTKHNIFITEPQLWYNVGRHFGCENLNIGTEIELSNNFGSTEGFKCRPCLGAKWQF